MDMLFAAVHPLVWTLNVYSQAYGEDDPEELQLLRLGDQERARAIVEVLQDLFFLAAPSLLVEREEEGPQEEIAPVEALHQLRRCAAEAAGYSVDDYHEGRVPPGHVYQQLINHSDCEGYYLPQDFPQAFWVDEVSVGSVPALLRDLQAVAPALAARYPVEWAAAEQGEELEATAGPVRVWQVLERLCRSSLELDLPLAFG